MHYEVWSDGKKINPAISMVLSNILGMSSGADKTESWGIAIFLEQMADDAHKGKIEWKR